MSQSFQSGQEYRIFVGAFPSGELADRIQALREQHDPKAACITAPHVTLAGTYWRSGPADLENEAVTIARLLAAQTQLRPFTLTLGGIRAFPPDKRVIYLAVEPTAELLAVRQVLLKMIGGDKHRRFTPHLTLTMRLNKRESRVVLTDLQNSPWHTGRWTLSIKQLWLMQRGSDDPAWRYIQRLDLADKGHQFLSR